MTTWADDRVRVVDRRPRRWLAESVVTGWPSADPELNDAVLERASDAELARLLNLYGWPCEAVVESLGPWTGGTHWP